MHAVVTVAMTQLPFSRLESLSVRENPSNCACVHASVRSVHATTQTGEMCAVRGIVSSQMSSFEIHSKSTHCPVSLSKVRLGMPCGSPHGVREHPLGNEQVCTATHREHSSRASWNAAKFARQRALFIRLYSHGLHNSLHLVFRNSLPNWNGARFLDIVLDLMITWRPLRLWYSPSSPKSASLLVLQSIAPACRTWKQSATLTGKIRPAPNRRHLRLSVSKSCTP